MVAEVALGCVKDFGDNRLAFGEQFVYDLLRACPHFLLTFKLYWSIRSVDLAITWRCTLASPQISVDGGRTPRVQDFRS